MLKQANKIPEIVDFIDICLKELDGPDKAAILKTVANYYEQVTQAEVMKITMTSIFKKL